jgi:hypothetical protein
LRTRIRQGMKAGANFAGHLALIEIGCGTGCRFVPVVDVRTGRVYDFPLGGEETPSLWLKYRPTSRYVLATWVEEGRCIRAGLIWNGSAFDRLPSEEERCYQLQLGDGLLASRGQVCAAELSPTPPARPH